jgi:general stress protein 26
LRRTLGEWLGEPTAGFAEDALVIAAGITLLVRMSSFEAGHRAMTDNEREYADLLAEHDTALLTTRGPDGHFHTRPMATQRKEHRGAIWFATSSGSDKCRDIRSEPRVALTFMKGERGPSYLSVSGTCRIVDDRALIHEMWDPSWRPWFPDGRDQADLVLLEVTPEHVEWVRPRGGKLKVLKTMVMRVLTRTREEPGEKKHLDLQ